jgi:hypothetical protein
VGKDAEKLDHLRPAGGDVNGAAILEKCLDASLNKCKN